MGIHSQDNNDITFIGDIRKQLEARIKTQHLTQQEHITSLQALVPDLISSLNLFQNVVSGFNALQYTPTSPPPLNLNPAPNPNKRNTDKPLSPGKRYKKCSLEPTTSFHKLKQSPEDILNFGPDNEKMCALDGMESPLSIVRLMVAVCLLERVPFTPTDSAAVLRKLENDQLVTHEEKMALLELGGEPGAILAVELALRSMAEDDSGVELDELLVNGKSGVMVLGINRSRLVKELPESLQLLRHQQPQQDEMSCIDDNQVQQIDLEDLLNKRSFMEQQKFKMGEELLELIHRPTAKEIAATAKFKSKGGSQVQECCIALTKEDCRRQSGSYVACAKVHFRRIIAQHTDISLGDCNYLNTCRHLKTCKYVHYELDLAQEVPVTMTGAEVLPPAKSRESQHAGYCSQIELGEPQWINCDIRSFKMDILGQFEVIMADPPWDIHMDLPYGTMADGEMKNLNVSALQKDGLIFLWVTGRAMELGRDCLELWGYKCIEEIIWVKTNQLQRIIRTGRTGHWLNHSKEHCLVGIKGNPEVNRNLDTDVIVSEVRETSRKPDEMYPLLERLSPGTRKLELFARTHNTHPGWISLGNQLNGVRLVDQGLRARFKAAYPDVEVQPPSPPRASAVGVDSYTIQPRSPLVKM